MSKPNIEDICPRCPKLLDEIHFLKEELKSWKDLIESIWRIPDRLQYTELVEKNEKLTKIIEEMMPYFISAKLNEVGGKK